MVDFDPSQLGPDELYLSGRIQVETAITVLEVTEANPDAVASLRGLRHAHELLSPVNEPDAPMDDLKIYLSGGSTAAMKASIIASALLAEKNEALSEGQRSAASGLLEILGVQK